MSGSSLITSRASAPLETGYIPVIDPASATVEEIDEWIIAQGGQPIPPEELKEFVAQAQWADVKAENPGDAEFPFACLGLTMNSTRGKADRVAEPKRSADGARAQPRANLRVRMRYGKLRGTLHFAFYAG